MSCLGKVGLAAILGWAVSFLAFGLIKFETAFVVVFVLVCIADGMLRYRANRYNTELQRQEEQEFHLDEPDEEDVSTIDIGRN